MAYADWSSTADANSTVGGISIAEGMDPSLVNNAIRALMADLAAENLLGSTALSSTVQAYDASLQAIADHTTTITGVAGTGVSLLSGTPGTAEFLPKWDSNGNLVNGFQVTNDTTLAGNSSSEVTTSAAVVGYVGDFFTNSLATTLTGGDLTDSIPYFDGSEVATTLNFLDEDDMASNDALGVASQQSIVTYVSNNTVGNNQTWQNVTGSRSTGTIYQNTTGRTIEVALRGSGGSSRTFDIGTDSGSLSPILDFSDSGSEGSSISLLIPDQTYYRMESGASISSWWELR